VARIRRAGIVIVAVLTAGWSVPAAERLPYRLSVEVEYGHPRGPADFSTELLRALRLDLDRAGCFRKIAPPAASPSDDDLVLVLTLDDFLDETRYETTLGERATSDNPAVERYVVAYASATVGMQVRTAAGGAVLRERRSHQQSSWRPVVDEDPRAMAREHLIDDLVRRSRKFVCKGSAKQWEKELRRARSAR
jgi:hypothetical protein